MQSMTDKKKDFEAFSAAQMKVRDFAEAKTAARLYRQDIIFV